jgi:hypothetical protein
LKCKAKSHSAKSKRFFILVLERVEEVRTFVAEAAMSGAGRENRAVESRKWILSKNAAFISSAAIRNHKAHAAKQSENLRRTEEINIVPPSAEVIAGKN